MIKNPEYIILTVAVCSAALSLLAIFLYRQNRENAKITRGLRPLHSAAADVAISDIRSALASIEAATDDPNAVNHTHSDFAFNGYMLGDPLGINDSSDQR